METVISTKSLTKKFGNFTAVDAISFDVKRAEIFGFLGANGAGKTTAIRMLTGLLSPTSGDAMVGGWDVHNETDKIKKNIGYMSQRFSLYNDLTVRENISFYAGIYGLKRNEIKSKTGELLGKLGMKAQENTFISALPLGWKQKLAFSVAIIHDPKIVFLDEPTGGVDPVTRRQFWKMIYGAASEGITVFVTTHYMDESEYCDRVSIMVDGRIEALDTPAGLKQKFNCQTMNDVFVKLARKKEAD